MHVERLSIDPLVLRLYNFCSDEEAAYLIDRSDRLLARSRVTCMDPDGCISSTRTSYGASIDDDAVTNTIRLRATEFSGFFHSESLQVVRYYPGQEFKPHLDAFDESEPGAREISSSGQRGATFLLYLNKPKKGGETVFPNLGLSCAPIARSAIFWRYQDARDMRVLHGGSPVLDGVKYAANIWMKVNKKQDEWVRRVLGPRTSAVKPGMLR